MPRWGVSEYFLYDPRAEYLAPALQGFRLREGEYRALPAVTVLPGRGVAVASAVLGLELRDEREAPMLRLRDPETGRDLLTYEEADEGAAAHRQEATAHRETQVRLEHEAEARQQEAAVHRETQVRLEQEAAARQRETEARRAAEARAAEMEARLRDLQDAS